MNEDEISESKDPHIRDFVYQFHSNGCIKRLKIPLNLPYIRDAREQALRLIKLHRMPSHLEDELHLKLQQFSKESSEDYLDHQAEESLPSDSVFDKVSGKVGVVCATNSVAKCRSVAFDLWTFVWTTLSPILVLLPLRHMPEHQQLQTALWMYSG